MDSSLIKIYGVFSKEQEVTLGTGVTRRKTLSKTYWFAKEVQGARIELLSLDMDFKPQGNLVLMDREEMLRDYLPEPQATYKVLSRPLMEGDGYRERGNYKFAVKEYEKVRQIDEENIRANFGLGISLLELGSTDKALYVFRNILELDEAFAEEHKHLFNELGIGLRRHGLYDQTLQYYFKAQEMTCMDENLQFNIARAYFEKGDTEKAVWHLAKALDMNSFFEEGLRFARYLIDRNLLPRQDSRRKQLILSLRAAGIELPDEEEVL